MRKLLKRALVAVVRAALDDSEVREMLVEVVTNDQEAERFVDGLIDDRLDRLKIDAESVDGLSREVESLVDDHLRHYKFDADQVDDLDQAIESQVLELLKDDEFRADAMLPAKESV
jgi:hypothetical protein